MIPMVPQIILFYEASIRKWRCYKAKQSKGQKTIRSYIKYNRAANELAEIEKINKDLKLIENVVETYGQMMFQLIILYRLTTLSADDLNVLGFFVIPFKVYMWFTLAFSFLGLLFTVRGYKIRGKEHFRPSMLSMKFVVYNLLEQFLVPLFLITTKV